MLCDVTSSSLLGVSPSPTPPTDSGSIVVSWFMAACDSWSSSPSLSLSVVPSPPPRKKIPGYCSDFVVNFLVVAFRGEFGRVATHTEHSRFQLETCLGSCVFWSVVPEEPRFLETFCCLRFETVLCFTLGATLCS